MTVGEGAIELEPDRLEEAVRQVLHRLFWDEQSTGRPFLQIRENESVGAVPVSGDLETAQQLVEKLRELFGDGNQWFLLKFDLAFDDKQGITELSCMPAGSVGFQEFPALQGTESDDPTAWLDGITTLNVKPKIEGTKWLSLVALAQDWDAITWLSDVEVETYERGLEIQLAELYRRALNQLFDDYGGLRQLHERRREVLRNRVKGKLDIGEYMQNVMGGCIESVPCRFSQLRVDCLPNRALLAALRIARRLEAKYGDLQVDDGNRDGRSLGQLEVSFGGVEHSPVSVSELDNMRLPEAFRGYEESGALQIARLLLEKSTLGDQPGCHDVTGFRINLAGFFEKAFAQVVARNVETSMGDIEQPNWSYTIDANWLEKEMGTKKRGSFQPDVYLSGQNLKDGSQAVVFDTKWKSGLEGDKERDMLANARVGNPDIYQITAYTQVASGRRPNREAIGVLVYPTTCTEVGNTLCRVQPEADDAELPVWVVGWDVTGDPAKSGGELVDEVRSLSREPKMRRDGVK